MLRIIAMVGDAEASAHIQAAVKHDAHLQFVSEPGRLAQHIGRSSFDVLVLGIREAGLPGVGALVRDTIATHPATRILLVCALVRPDVCALLGVRHFDFCDLILPRSESPAMTRRRLLTARPADVADMQVRRMLSSSAPEWIRHFIDWCAGHNGAVRPNVRALAALDRVRPETLARLFKAHGACPPNHLISWVLVLRARVRFERPRASLSTIAYELGLASGGSLANLITRRSGMTPTELRRQRLEDLVDRAIRGMFGGRPDRDASVTSIRAIDQRGASKR